MLSISVNYFRVSKDGERRLARRESGGREQAEAEQPAEDPAEEAERQELAQGEEDGEVGHIQLLQGG